MKTFHELCIHTLLYLKINDVINQNISQNLVVLLYSFVFLIIAYAVEDNTY